MAKNIEPEMLTICADIIQETDVAVLVKYDGEEYWLPKSQIEYDGFVDELSVEFRIPDWLAEEKGLEHRQGFNPDEAPDPAAIPADCHFLERETVNMTQTLTTEEKASFAEEMAELDNEIISVEMERDSVMKSLKKQIDAMEDKRRHYSRIVHRGEEDRTIYCLKLADFSTGEIVWVEASEPYAEVDRRKMTEEQRQMPLLQSHGETVATEAVQ